MPAPIHRKRWRVLAASAGLLCALCSCSGPEGGPVIEVWHGSAQKVGHLGSAQDDFNLMGSVHGPAAIASLTYSLNGGAPAPLTTGEGPFGFRRLAGPGFFNADIAISRLRPGRNIVVLSATDSEGGSSTETVTVSLRTGSYPLPVFIDWEIVTDPQEAGQYVDGRWGLEAGGLRTLHMGYDRVFLIGEKHWQDYEVSVPVTINEVSAVTAPRSGGNGVGIILRFAGHVVGGHRDFPEAQPKWGYQPFGAIAWLRWEKDKPREAPRKQFYRGDNDKRIHHERYPVVTGRTYRMKAACQTLPDDPGGFGVTKYSFKIWMDGEPEPAAWDWEETQVSEHALRRGGVALLAHHVDATFGNVSIEQR